MYKYFFLFVAAIFCCAQCLPLDATHSESSSSSQLHLIMNNSSRSSNYHLTPVMRELDDVDQEIDDQLKAILPYLNFFFESLLGQSNPADDDCISDMVIELVPDEQARLPESAPTDKKEPQTGAKPNSIGKSAPKSSPISQTPSLVPTSSTSVPANPVPVPASSHPLNPMDTVQA